MSWVNVEERGSLLGMRFVVGALKLCGRRFAGFLCEPVFLYFFLVDGRARRASRHYLRRVCATAEGRKALGREPGPWASWQHIREFGNGLLDRATVWGGGGARFAIDFPERAEFLRVQASGRGAILLGAHLGSFDFLRAVASKKGVPVNMLLFERNARKINAVLKALAPDRDVRAIPFEPGSIQSILEIQACIDRGEFVAVLGDRAELASPKQVGRAQFLGTEAEFPVGPLVMAHALHCPIYLLFALRTGPDAYQIRFERFAERIQLSRGERQQDLAHWLDRYVRRLEEICREYPLQWSNFYDFWGDDRILERSSQNGSTPESASNAETIRT